MANFFPDYEAIDIKSAQIGDLVFSPAFEHPLMIVRDIQGGGYFVELGGGSRAYEINESDRGHLCLKLKNDWRFRVSINKNQHQHPINLNPGRIGLAASGRYLAVNAGTDTMEDEALVDLDKNEISSSQEITSTRCYSADWEIEVCSSPSDWISILSIPIQFKS